jgi:hypothetical protein
MAGRREKLYAQHLAELDQGPLPISANVLVAIVHGPSSSAQALAPTTQVETTAPGDPAVSGEQESSSAEGMDPAQPAITALSNHPPNPASLTLSPATASVIPSKSAIGPSTSRLALRPAPGEVHLERPRTFLAAFH